MSRRLLPLVLVTGALGACASVPAAEPCRLPDGSCVPIVNFVQVCDGVYRGAQPDKAGFAALKALGVKTVINLREPKYSDAALAKEAGIDLVEIPLHARVTSDPPTDAEIRQFLAVALDPEKRPVYVHCKHGKDRTGTMCAVYRIEVDGWDGAKAYGEMQKHGFHDWYRDLAAFVKRYTPKGLVAALTPAKAADSGP